MSSPEQVDPARIFSFRAFEEINRGWSQAIADYLLSVSKRPVMQWASPLELAGYFDDDSFEEGIGREALLEQFQERILPWCQHHYHPLSAGHMVGCPLPIAVVADLAASLLNQGMGIWEVSPGPVMLTQKVIEWFLRTAGFGPHADGVLTTGGSEANLTAVLAARSRVFGSDVRETGIRQEDQPVLFSSELAHYSVARAAGVAGIGRRRVETVPTDSTYRMEPYALEAGIKQALGERKRIICVVATAGTTSVGTFDPIGVIADICTRYGIWLHVDGAHGASLLLSDKGRKLMAGVERSDSLTWDPHKMLFVPSALGMLLVANGRDLEAVFDERPQYLFGKYTEDEAHWNFTRKNLRCTQRFDALRLWAVFKLHGRKIIGNLLDRTMELAQYLWNRLEEEPLFKPLIAPSFNIVCFRFVPADFKGSEKDLDVLNESIRVKLLRDGSAWITTVECKGRVYLRVTVMNPASSEKDMEVLIRLVQESGDTILKNGGLPGDYQKSPD